MLDITAFSNALRDGNVSFLQSLSNVRPFLDDDGAVVHFSGEDAVVFPLGGGDGPRYALRLPLEHGSDRTWPSLYADLASTVGTIAGFLPSGITILDVEDLPGTDVALLYDWVPGEALTTRVARTRDRESLTELLWPLAEVGEALRISGMVHGDIAPGNIIVRPDGGMVLIDLDHAALRGNEGAPSPRRRPGYRMPRGGGSPVEEDAFSLLVLMASCAMLADSDVPIELDEATGESHPTLLFSSWDLMDPQRSRLVREIEHQLSPLSLKLLELLTAACNRRSDLVPTFLRDAIQHIRRAGPRPAATVADEPVQASSWQPAASRDQEDVDHEEPNLPEEAAHESTADWSWPSYQHAEPETPVATPDRTGGRSVDQIVAEIEAITVPDVPDRGGERRAARAEQRRQQVTRELKQALAVNDRQVLVRLAMSGALAELGDSDRQELLTVVRALAHDSIQRAIARDDDGMIVAAVDESVFRTDSDLEPAFRDRVRLARDREQWTDLMLEVVREGDAERCTELVNDAPEHAFLRLPESVRNQAERLMEQREAVLAARDAIDNQDADGLAMALGQLVKIYPTWIDEVDPKAVLELLGEEQIEQRLVAKLAGGKLDDEDHWMVDIVIAEGRLPEATRLAGLSSHDVDRLIYKDV